MTDFDRIRRRHLVAIATSEFEHYPRLEEVPDEVARVAAWLADESRLGGRHFVPQYEELADGPARAQIERLLRDTPEEDRWKTGDAAVVYITGHGEVDKIDERPRHFLALKTTNRDTNLTETALPTADLIRWLSKTSVEYLLVVIDVCHAGLVIEEIARDRQIMDRVKDHWLILPSTLTDEAAEQGALAKAIGVYLDTAAQYNVRWPYLTVSLFVDTINLILKDIAPGQQVKGLYQRQLVGLAPGGAPDPHACLPNPAYRPDEERVKTSPALEGLALEARFLALHNRVAGRRPAAGSPGWLFTGRERLMRDLIDAVGQPGITMVTGSAGCGKSTALARLVTLSDRGFRAQYARELKGVPQELLPPRGAVDVALLPYRLSIRDVLTQICHDLGVSGEIGLGDVLPVNRRALSDYLGRQQRPVTVVVDALDEAEDAAGLVTSVFQPLLEEHPDGLCLLVGVRTPGGDGAADEAAEPGEESLAELLTALGARRIAADDSVRWDDADLITFTGNILANTDESPYGNVDGTTVRRFAEVIAGRAGRSYLTAKVAAQSLTQRPAMSPDAPAWLAALQQGTLGPLRDDLKASLRTPQRLSRGVTLLRAAAFARGNGVPRAVVWPELASAIGAVDGVAYRYGDGDVRELLGSRASAYLKTDEEDGLTVYRLMHDELRDILRTRWRELLATGDGAAPPSSDAEIRQVEEAIAWRLRGEAEQPPTAGVGRPVPAYIRRRLAEHALAGEVLERYVPVPFLPYLDLKALRAAVGASPLRRELDLNVPWLPLLQQATHLWDWYRPARNAAAIEMWAMLNETSLPGAGREPGPVGGPWQVRWAIRPPDSSNLLGRHADGVLAVATAEMAAGPVAVTGGQDGLLRVWDMGTGGPYRDRGPIDVSGGAGQADKGGAVRAVTCVTTIRLADGRTAAVSGSADGFVRVWDLATGRALGLPLATGGKKVEALAAATLPSGQALVSAADDRGEIRTWNLETGEPTGRPLPCGPGLALGLSTALVGGRLLGLATGEDSGLQLWDVITGEPAGPRLTGHPFAERPGTGTINAGRAVAAAVLGGREIAVTGNGDGLLLWDLKERGPAGRRLRGDAGTVRAVAVAPVGDLVLAVTGGDQAVQVWDLAAGDPLGELLTGPGGSVEAVAIGGSADGGAFAVSAGRDASVRMWEVPGAALSPRRPSQPVGIVESVATARAPHGGGLVITGSHTLAQVWDLERGGDPVELTGYDSPVVSVTAAERPDGVLVVGGHWDGTISTWRAASGELVARGPAGDIGAAAALATAVVGERLVALAGGWDGSITVWDPFTGTRIGDPLPWHTDVVTAVATTRAGGQRTLLVSGGRDGCLRIGDLARYADPGSPEPVAPAASLGTAVSLGTPVASLTVTELADGRHAVVVGGEDGRVYLRGFPDAAPLAEPWQAAGTAVAAVAAGRLPDGRVAVFTGGEEPFAAAWDAATGQPVTEALPVPGPVLALAFEPGTSSLVVGGTGVAVARPRLAGHGEG